MLQGDIARLDDRGQVQALVGSEGQLRMQQQPLDQSLASGKTGYQVVGEHGLEFSFQGVIPWSIHLSGQAVQSRGALLSSRTQMLR